MNTATGKPRSEACERNREPILRILRPLLAAAGNVLEIGSGTGQHAVHFGAALSHLVWQTSDLAQNHPGIKAWIAEAGLENVLAPCELDVGTAHWPVDDADAVFTANTLHIMSWSEVESLFAGVTRILRADGLFCIYGPFNYNGTHTADSNASFDAMLRARDPASGIRNIEDVRALGSRNGLDLEADHEMPANNRLIVFRKE